VIGRAFVKLLLRHPAPSAFAENPEALQQHVTSDPRSNCPAQGGYGCSGDPHLLPSPRRAGALGERHGTLSFGLRRWVVNRGFTKVEPWGRIAP
jgi:hypothetical protein